MSTKSYSARLTSELHYSCSSFKVKGRWGSSCRNASFDLASPELRVPDFEVRSVHESTTKSPINTPLWILPRLPHEEAHHSTHTYLVSFRSIHSSCLIIRYRFQVVLNRGRGYSNSFVNIARV